MIKGIDPMLTASFRQVTMTLAQALRVRAGRELSRSSGRLDAAEEAAVQLTRGQLCEITTLTEEIVSRWRSTRMVLIRLIEQFERDERALQGALLQPADDLRRVIAELYGGGGAT
jgi:hypothetical protein